MSTKVTGYRQKLKEVYHHATKNHANFEGTMTQWMQKDYPGNYMVQEAYIPDRGCWGAKLIFESEQDEIMFKLRYE